MLRFLFTVQWDTFKEINFLIEYSEISEIIIIENYWLTLHIFENINSKGFIFKSLSLRKFSTVRYRNRIILCML